MILRSMIPPINQSKNRKTKEDYPSYINVYPELKELLKTGSRSVRKTMVLLLVLLTGAANAIDAQSTKGNAAMRAYQQLFEKTNVGNLHIYALNEETETPAEFYYGELIPRGLYGLFSANWRDELPADFEAYALFQIKYGASQAYIMRFAGSGTQNLIGLFTVQHDKIVLLKALATHSCDDLTCWQTDSWIQDFDGDTRLDILQKARMLQFTLMGAPVTEYVQMLRQNKDGRFVATSKLDVDLKNYQFADDSDSLNQ